MPVNFLVPKDGIAAVVYTDNAGPALYTLGIRTVNSQPAITLSRALHVQSFDDEQLFTLELDADNLAPKAAICAPADAKHELPPQAYIDRISRTGSSSSANLLFLCLETKRCCHIKCPPSSGTITPVHDTDADFAHFTELARGTVFHVLFDYRWVHISKREALRDLVTNLSTQGLAFQPSLESQHKQPDHRQTDWTILGPAEPPREALPDYVARSSKRARSRESAPCSSKRADKRINYTTTANTASPPLATPPHKRGCGPLEAVGSPTEVATPASLRSSLGQSLLTKQAAAQTVITVSTLTFATENDPIFNKVKDMVDASVASQLADFAEEAYGSVESQCKNAGWELEESLNDHRTSMLAVKEEELEEFTRACEDKLAELKESISELGEDERPPIHTERQLLDEEAKLLANEASLLEREEQHLHHVRRHLENKRHLLLKKRQYLESTRKPSSS